ncbi:unnamed protein product [Adineta steineri]|uniref:NAD(P)(+)--arginine ADP-ribosyltransferase n=1 Tax=Adineta steineri TaxID=433720 RepID=A0A815UEA2_9BILA|nr:unnamed protein product [Adineta steineri]CAF3700421.1 unnamed protein product [Adineta steineri]
MGTIWSRLRGSGKRSSVYPHSSVNILPDASILRDIEDVSVVWLDTDIERTEDCIDTELELRRCITYLRTFTDLQQCLDYITSLPSPNEKIFIIVSGTLGMDLLDRIHNFDAILRAYIFCGNKQFHEQWSRRFSKVSGIFTDKHHLVSQLIIDLARDAGHLTPMQIFHTDMNQKSIHDLNKETASFMWFQLLIKILLKMNDNDSAEARNDFIETCRKRYQNDRKEQERITEFENTYTKDQAIKWYTKDAFLYRSLNRALRTADIEIIFHFRYIMSDIHEQLISLPRPSNSNLIVYRGQLLSTRELSLLKDNIGGFISMNTFMSTTEKSNLGVSFSNYQITLPSGLHSVFFEINVNSTKTPYARIDNLSCIQQEKEILFSLGTVFHIEDVCPMGSMWHVELTLTTDIEQRFETIMDYYEKEIGDRPSVYMLGRFFIMQGDLTRAQRYYEFLLHEAVTDNEDKNRMICLGFLGYIAQENGQLEKALQFYLQQLDIQQTLLEPGDERMATTYSNIGTIYNTRGEYKEALKFFELCLSIELLSKSENQSEISTTYNNIGNVYNNMNDYENARINYEKTLQLMNKDIPLEHPSWAITWSNLGSVYNDMGNHAEAIEYFERALRSQIISLPPEHPSRLSTESNLALSYLYVGDHQKAQEKYQKVLDATLRIKPPNMVSIAKAYRNIGIAFQMQHEYKRALIYFNKAFHIQQRHLSANDPDLGLTYINLTDLYISMGQKNNAFEASRRSLEIFQKQEPLNVLRLAKIYDTLSSLEDDVEKAIQYQEEALAFLLKIKYGNKQLVAGAYNNLGNRYKLAEQFDKALCYFKQALDINNELTNGDQDHVSLAEIYANIGDVQYHLGNTSDALDYLMKSVNIQLKMRDYVQNPDLAETYDCLGRIYCDLKQYELSLVYYEKAIKIWKLLSEIHDIQLATTYQHMAFMYAEMGQWEQAVEYHQKTLSIQLKCSELNKLELADTYFYLADLHDEHEDYQHSLSFYRKMLDIKEKVLSKDHLDVAKAYELVAMSYHYNNEFKAALTMISRALHIRQRKNDTVGLAYTHECLGMVYEGMIELKKALNHYELGIEHQIKVIPQDYYNLCSLYLLVGQLCYRLNDDVKALEYLNQTLMLQLEHLDDEQDLRKNTYTSLAKVHKKLGNEEKANDYNEKCRSLDTDISF